MGKSIKMAAGTLWLASVPDLMSDGEVFCDFLYYSTELMDKQFTLVTSSERDAIGLGPAAAEYFKLQRVKVDYNWDPLHYEGFPIAHIYPPQEFVSFPMPPETEENYTARLLKMLKPPNGYTLVLLTQQVMDKVSELKDQAKGLVLLCIFMAPNRTITVKQASGYDQFYRFSAVRRKQIGALPPELPYTGPVGDLAEPLEGMKNAIVAALRDRVLDAVDLQHLEKAIRLSTSKIAFILQNRYKICFTAVYEGYHRLLKGINNGTHVSTEKIKRVIDDHSHIHDLLEKVEDMIARGPGEAELWRNVQEIRKKLMSYEQSNRAVADLTVHLYGKVNRSTIQLLEVRKLPGKGDGMYEIDMENIADVEVENIDVVIQRGVIRFRVREPENFQPGRITVPVRVDQPGKIIIYSTQNTVKVSNELRLDPNIEDVPAQVEGFKAAFPTYEARNRIPKFPTEQLFPEQSKIDKYPLRPSKVMYDFFGLPKPEKQEYPAVFNPFNLDTKHRERLPPEGEKTVHAIRQETYMKLTPLLRWELQELMRTEKGRAMTCADIIDVLIRI